MNLSNAFYTSRVGRSLHGIAQYLNQAVELADGVKPPGNDIATLKSTTRPSRPILEKVEPPSIGWDQRADGFELNFLGTHLSRVERFALVPAKDLDDDDLVMTKASCLTDKGFKAEVDLKDARAGVYHAWVRDRNGMEALLLNAFTIQPEPEKATTPSPYGASSPPYVAAQPPCIVSQPQNCTVAEGENASFVAQATGTAPLKYQWQKDGTDLPGECSETLNLQNVTQQDAGTYQVAVSNRADCKTSDSATLYVTPCPTTAPAPVNKAKTVKKAQK